MIILNSPYIQAPIFSRIAPVRCEVFKFAHDFDAKSQNLSLYLQEQSSCCEDSILESDNWLPHNLEFSEQQLLLNNAFYLLWFSKIVVKGRGYMGFQSAICMQTSQQYICISCIYGCLIFITSEFAPSVVSCAV